MILAIIEVPASTGVALARPAQAPLPGLSRHLPEPTDASFHEQDSRIGAIEAGLKELRQLTEERHLQLQSERKEDCKRQKAAVGELHGQINAMSQEFARQLQQSVEGLQGAQTQQMQQVLSNFDAHLVTEHQLPKETWT